VFDCAFAGSWNYIVDSTANAVYDGLAVALTTNSPQLILQRDKKTKRSISAPTGMFDVCEEPQSSG
jgi:hypothetical protein